jgi:type II secretory ATPase GspE/PulE/Tfp pilus assembly ATPase PilB-like protein
MNWREFIFAGAIVFTVAVADMPVALAQQPAPAVAEPDKWPSYELPTPPSSFGKAGIQNSPRGRSPGLYFNLLKLVAVLALFFLWVKTTDWAGQDCVRLNLNYVIWSAVLIGPFVGCFILLLLLPWFEIGALILVAAYLVPLIVYLAVRNKGVEAHQKVMTPSHLRHVFADAAGKVGIKVAAEKKLDHEKGPPVHFKATAGGGRDGSANLMLARRSPGYVPAKEVVADLFDRYGDSVMLEATAANVALRFQIDGVWHNNEARDAEPGNLLIAVFKTLAGLDANERAKRQEGMFPVEYKKINYAGRVQSQGLESGERVIVHFHPQKTPIKTLDELGMRAKTQEQMKELLAKQAGFVIFSSLPGGGLSSLFDAALKACDRYMRDFAAVDDLNHREHDIENVQVTTYNPAAGEKALAALEKVVRTYPNVLVVRSLTEGDTAKFLCEQVKEERLVITSLRAKDAPESLLRVLMLKVPPREFGSAVNGVVCVRLIRKLCEDCKEPYPAPAELLAQFGIPAGKVQTLFQPPTQADPKKPCATCQGIGYKGRTGLFELLTVDDGVREVLMKSPKIDLLRAAARRGGMKTFQEEGLVLVVKGVTSLVELQRVLKT